MLQSPYIDFNDASDRILTADGHYYDLTRFSKTEADTIINILAKVDRLYSDKSVGLVCESAPIVYKPRYVLYEIAILLYSTSKEPIDQLAVALAYETKGAYFRKQAIQYFEKSISKIRYSKLKKFYSYSPFTIYIKFAQLYDKEHDYQNTIFCLKKAKKCKGANRKLIKSEIKRIEEKMVNPPKRRKSTMPERQALFEQQVTTAAKFFIDLFWRSLHC